ncbi:MAG TPA: hypothetical protein VGS03_12665 [Candidatus Polarisedimenticolia bacterium]|jgi:hypothetical protein|nr:hypothetical protein [Candidatus Polarisedimenticolia bacterium]
MMAFPGTLDGHFRQIEEVPAVRKSDLEMGDCLVVETRNSRYHIVSLGDGTYQISGGWFEREAGGPIVTTIAGCTWGGSAIHTELVAAQGLFLEFGNRVMTTRIRAFKVIPAPSSDSIH